MFALGSPSHYLSSMQYGCFWARSNQRIEENMVNMVALDSISIARHHPPHTHPHNISLGSLTACRSIGRQNLNIIREHVNMAPHLCSMFGWRLARFPASDMIQTVDRENDTSCTHLWSASYSPQSGQTELHTYAVECFPLISRFANMHRCKQVDRWYHFAIWVYGKLRSKIHHKKTDPASHHPNRRV